MNRRAFRWWLGRLWLVPVCAVEIGMNLGTGEKSAAVAWAVTLFYVVMSPVIQVPMYSTGFWRGQRELGNALTQDDPDAIVKTLKAQLEKEPRPWDPSPPPPKALQE